jgi:hypothetical protein
MVNKIGFVINKKNYVNIFIYSLGTRYPSDGDINRFIELEEIFKNISYAKDWVKNYYFFF